MIKSFLLFIILLTGRGLSFCSTTGLKQFSKRLYEETAEIDDVTFEFTQKIYVAGSTDTVKAEVFYKRPGLFFVSYTRPAVQEIYFDGEHLITYTPRIRQATSRKVDFNNRILGVSAGIIFSSEGLEDLKKDHKIQMAEEEEGVVKIEAVPHQKREYEKMFISFDSKTMLPFQARTTAPHASSVTRFKNYRLNSSLEEDVFHFEPPDNVDFIRLDKR